MVRTSEPVESLLDRVAPTHRPQHLVDRGRPDKMGLTYWCSLPCQPRPLILLMSGCGRVVDYEDRVAVARAILLYLRGRCCTLDQRTREGLGVVVFK